jgi:hypothetical protein
MVWGCFGGIFDPPKILGSTLDRLMEENSLSPVYDQVKAEECFRIYIQH